MTAPDTERFPVPEWSPVPREGCLNVDGRVLGIAGSVSLALLRFGETATIAEHSAPFEIDVYCLEGRGYASVAGEAVALTAGDHMRWPAGRNHRLWTDGSAMITLMAEHHA